jgi:uncharacterized membrane protein
MPYEWTKPAGGDNPPLHRLTLWPYRSLPRRGFVWFIGLTCALITLPLLALLGTKYLWIMLPFLVAAVGAIWYFLERSYKDGTIVEHLDIWRDTVRLTRKNPRSPDQTWEANPYWITTHTAPTGGPVPHYLTLRGGPREVELGVFLTPNERKTLQSEIIHTLANLDF